MSHDLVDELTEPLHTTVWCSCGKSWQHPDREGAVKRHAGHVLIEDARASLNGGKK